MRDLNEMLYGSSKPPKFTVHYDTAGVGDCDADPAESWVFEEFHSAKSALSRAKELRAENICAQIRERSNFEQGRFGWEYDEVLVWEDGEHLNPGIEL